MKSRTIIRDVSLYWKCQPRADQDIKSADEKYATSRDAWIRLFKGDDNERVIANEDFIAGNKVIRDAYRKLANLSPEQLEEIRQCEVATDIIKRYREEGRKEGRKEYWNADSYTGREKAGETADVK